ncbi:MAG: DUF1343 domain-containing protein [Deltaproteobacteria bacterium]|nr:DUF1343 domain-containing protein [Deltaproteobacteria bacterium]
MKTLFAIALLFWTFSPATAAVLPGIDVLEQRGFDILKGKRVGLITNHTGRSLNGRSTIDILNRADDVRLTALLSPEHGIRGTEDEKVSSSFDSATGLPVHSLYGKSCRPTPEMLREVDVLLFDIQDIGARFYTYIGTLSLAMRAAREAGIPFVVLDRSNPIGGVAVAGAIPASVPPEKASGCGAITSIHPIPTRHGMTIGELARLFNSEFGINCQLTVIPMQGWLRSMHYDQTGLTWVNPSPNMKSPEAALLYPGLGILETSNLSVGRGTERPFQLYGAPWVNAAAVMDNLAKRSIPGLSFAPASFVPTTPGHPHRGRSCHGVSVTVTDREKLDPVLAGLQLVQAFYETHPDHFRAYGGFATEVGDREAWNLLTRKRMAPELVTGRWKEDLERFRRVRERYLLY